MKSRQLLSKQCVFFSSSSSSKCHQDLLSWSVNNFTQDFLANSFKRSDPYLYQKFLNSNLIAFKLTEWIPSSSKQITPDLIKNSGVSVTPIFGMKRWKVQTKGSMSYSTKTGNNSLDLPKELSDILNTDNDYTDINQVIEITKNLDTKNLLVLRKRIYSYILGSESEHRLEFIQDIFNAIPVSKRSKYDFATLIQCAIDQNPGIVENLFKDAAKNLSNRGILELLFSALKHLYSLASFKDLHHFTLNLYYSVLLKQHGTLRFIDRTKFKSERAILAFIMKSNPEYIRVLVRMMQDKPAFSQQLVTTCMDIDFANHRPSSVIDIFNAKESEGLSTTHDLYLVMKAYLMTGQADLSLEAYKRNASIHANWLFDVVLKSYASKLDWNGMQKTFESLFGRGDLPNLEHYRIVMEAISKIARTDILDSLYKNLKARMIKPNVAIHNAIMYSRYAFGDVNGTEQAFNNIKGENLVPNLHSYMILLLMYRDAQDISKAYEVLEEMSRNGLTPNRSIITTIVSLCAERKDPYNAKRCLQLLEDAGMSPDITFYNALLECFVQSKYLNDANEIISEMRRKGMKLRLDTITILFKYYSKNKMTEDIAQLNDVRTQLEIHPDAKLYSIMLQYLVDINDVNKAEELVQEIEEQSEPNVYHFTILMQGFLNHRKYEKVLSLFEHLITKNIQPTSVTYSILIRALEYIHPGQGYQYLKNLIVTNSQSVDLTSKYLPRSIISPEVIAPVLKQLTRSGDEDKIGELLRQISSSGINGINVLSDPNILRRLAIAFGSIGYWDDFDAYFQLLMEKERKLFVPTPIKSGGTIDIIPIKDSFSNDEVFRMKFNRLAQTNRFEDVLPFYNHLRLCGYRFSNFTINSIIELLVTNPETFPLAYDFCATKLAYKSIRIISQSSIANKFQGIKKDPKVVGQYKMSLNVRNTLADEFPRFIAWYGAKHGCKSEQEAFDLYSTNHRRMAGLLKFAYEKRHNVNSVYNS